MPSIALTRHDVIVGVDTHEDQHIAVANDGLGGLIDQPVQWIITSRVVSSEFDCLPFLAASQSHSLTCWFFPLSDASFNDMYVPSVTIFPYLCVSDGFRFGCSLVVYGRLNSVADTA